MEFLLSHWHCILPIAGIVIVLFLMREKPVKEISDDKTTKVSKNINQE